MLLDVSNPIYSAVSLSKTAGTLNPGATDTLTVSINSNANNLAASDTPYTDTVTFTNTTNGAGDTTRGVALKVLKNGSLSVTPADGLSSSGSQGGPFSPSSKPYTLTNGGGQAISWTAAKGQNWVLISKWYRTHSRP